MGIYTSSLSTIEALLTTRKAIDVADRYPHATVRGVDLSPPPEDWVPPNCILEGMLFLTHHFRSQVNSLYSG